MQKKPFATIPEQVAVLESRGMYIADKEATELFLLGENYYSVVNGYKDMFLDEEETRAAHEDRYVPGTTFSHVKLLYMFDRRLRRISFDALLRAETIMKTATIYSFCEKHRDHNDYLDPACYCSSKDYLPRADYTRNLIKMLSTLQRLHDNGQHKEFIQHYLKEHKCVPLWVLSRCLTFGNVSAFYDLQTTDVQNAACKAVCRVSNKERITPKQLRDVFRTLSAFRNICAHDERLFCARVGPRKDKSFADLLLSLSIVLDERTVSGLAQTIKELLEKLAELDDLDMQVMTRMAIGYSRLDSFIKEA